MAANNLRILRCDNAANALKVVEKTPVGVVVAAMELEPFDGMELLGRILQQSPQTLVILTAGFPTTGQIIEATQRGAHDVLRKESLAFELRPVVESALQTQEDRRSAGQPDAELPEARRPGENDRRFPRACRRFSNWSAASPARDAPVLIAGESGTGKELVAKARARIQPAPAEGDDHHQLRRDSGKPVGKRALRPRKRLVHRGHRPPRGTLRTGGRRHACFSTKSATCRSPSR